jgi:hypothetical protein
MAGLSLNQMYKQSGAGEAGISYKDWIAGEEALYNTKIERGKILGQMPFAQWMEMRWQGKLNASGKLSEVLQGLKGIGKSVLDKTILKQNTATSTTAAPDESTTTFVATTYTEPEKRILGMKPLIFWSLTGVVILTATIVTIKVVKKMKKS